ncbi:VanZ like family protein [Anaerosphaera aminiphila DSM 21120]|uniref:VanZ like family protein n=1 Tax=Anaerosphaera aminiphila DSM 21120 TaxID=1120995 RepID=A0A1M5V039_9FIRM|nr:VanZ family protein [Anaerosphaera aminiphila]SHH68313.1 VanZ like family protein [Anaerosphaera aminiphila DSM 21120]
MKILLFFLTRGIIVFILTFSFFSIIRTKYFSNLKKNSSVKREFLLSIFVAYIAVLFLFLFTPNVFIANHGIDLTAENFDFVGDFQDRINSGSWGVNFHPFKTIKNYINHSSFQHAFLNIAGNIILFIPLGAILPTIYKGCRKFYKTTLFCICFSLFIEFVQFFIGRSVDIDDLILNTIGGIVGYVLFYILNKVNLINI